MPAPDGTGSVVTLHPFVELRLPAGQIMSVSVHSAPPAIVSVVNDH
jgi:hypothetical protein